MRSLSFLFLLWFTISSAHADTYKVYASYAVAAESDKPCGPATKAEIGQFMTSGLELTLTDAVFSYFQRDSRYEGTSSDKRYVQDGTTYGIWHRGRRSIVIQVSPKKNGDVSVTVTFLVEKDANKRDQVSCFEQWIGARGVRS